MQSTREEKQQRLLLLQEKERRLKTAKPPFVPNEGQLKVLSSKALVRLVTAGNGSGKTGAAVAESYYVASGHNPITKERHIVPNKVIYVLDRPGKVSDKIVPEFKKFFDTSSWEFLKDGTPSIRRIKLPNESEIIFMFHEQEAMAYESIDGYALAVFDEPPPRHCYIGLRRGGRSKGFRTRYLIIGTPLGSNSSWMRTELLEQWKNGDTDIDVLNFSTSVNEANLEDGYIERFSKALSEKERTIRLHGEWSDLDGLALSHLWKDDTHLFSCSGWNPDHPVIIAIDPHPTKPHMALMLGVDPDNRLYVIKELTQKAVARQFARTLRTWYEGFKVIDIVCDNLGSADLTGAEGFKSFIEVLKEEGVRVRPTRYEEKADGEWITRLQNALLIPTEPDSFGHTIPKLRIDPSCRTVISDIKNVQWQKIRNYDEYKPTLDIGNKDGIACLKYALAANLFYTKTGVNAPLYMKSLPYGVQSESGPRRPRIFRRRR